MRVIVLALILANLLFFMWSTWVAEPPVDVPLQQADGSAELLLMSELDNPPDEPALVIAEVESSLAEPDAKKAVADTPASEEPAVVTSGAESANAQPAIESVGEAPAPAESVLVPMLELPGNATQSSAVAQAQATPAESVGQSDGAIELNAGGEEQTAAASVAPVENGASDAQQPDTLSPAAPVEPVIGDSVAGITVDTPEAIQAALAQVDSRCASLGPYLNLREATEAASRLRVAGLAPRQRLSEEQVWVGHWVYLPSYDSRDEAVAVVERLRTEGVKDLYIEPRGDRENAVSLGLFSDRENAELFAGKVRQYDVRPQITDRYRLGSAYWVDFALSASQPFDIREYQSDAVRKVRLEEDSCGGKENE